MQSAPSLHVIVNRWSINCVLFRGEDLVNEEISGDDEQALSWTIPERRQLHCAAAGQALAVHYSFYSQRIWLDQMTHILDEYAELAWQQCPGS